MAFKSGLFYYADFIANIYPAKTRMQDVLAKVDFIICSPVHRKCPEWLLSN